MPRFGPLEYFTVHKSFAKCSVINDTVLTQFLDVLLWDKLDDLMESSLASSGEV